MKTPKAAAIPPGHSVALDVTSAFDVAGESAAHPLSSESGMEDAIREAATEIITALQ